MQPTLIAHAIETRTITIHFIIPANVPNPKLSGGQRVCIDGKTGYISSIEYVDLPHAVDCDWAEGWHYQVSFDYPWGTTSTDTFSEGQLLELMDLPLAS